MRMPSTSVIWGSIAAALVISLAAAGGACFLGYRAAVSKASAFEGAIAAEHQRMRDAYDAMRQEFAGVFPGVELPDHVLRKAARLAVRSSGPNAARGAQEEGKVFIRMLSMLSSVPPQAQDNPELAVKVTHILQHSAQDIKTAENNAREINVKYQAALNASWTGYWMKRAGYPKNIAPPGATVAPTTAAQPAAAETQAVPAPPAPVPAPAAPTPAAS